LHSSIVLIAVDFDNIALASIFNQIRSCRKPAGSRCHYRIFAISMMSRSDVAIDGLAGDKVARVRGQEDDCADQVARLFAALDNLQVYDLLAKLLEGFPVRDSLGCIGYREARRYHIDVDSGCPRVRALARVSAITAPFDET
jgi:hypothetical protein